MRAQQFGLHDERQLADFIEKQRAAIGTADEAKRGGNGAGESALHVAEQLRLHQLGRKHGAIDGHKRPVGAGTKSMDLPSGDFFADAGFAFDEHSRRARGNELDLRAQCIDAPLRSLGANDEAPSECHGVGSDERFWPRTAECAVISPPFCALRVGSGCESVAQSAGLRQGRSNGRDYADSRHQKSI